MGIQGGKEEKRLRKSWESGKIHLDFGKNRDRKSWKLDKAGDRDGKVEEGEAVL